MVAHNPSRDDAAAGAGAAPAAAAGSHGTISEIVAEFSQVFAFARTRWARFAEEIHPDLGGTGMMVLQTIMRRGPVTATGLSQMLDMDKAVVSRQVAKLRDFGFVQAEPSSEDRRVILLRSSERADAAYEAMQTRTESAYVERFSGWSGDELEDLRVALHRFNATQWVGEPEHLSPARRCAQHERDEQAAAD